MALLFLSLLASLLCSLTSSFQPLPQPRNTHQSCLFYKTDDDKEASSLIHHQRHEHVLSAPTFVFETELWSQEWHDSFVRNELVDFCPPLSTQLNCLLLGNAPNEFGAPLLLNRGNHEKREPTNDDTVDSIHGDETTNVDEKNEQDSMAQARLLSLLNSQNDLFSHSHEEQQATDLDCIFDPGLLDSLLLEHKERDVGLLLLEATQYIREFGVYICVTQAPLSPDIQEYLQSVGTLLGMQWSFHLDGISNDINGTVSVARKYFVGELPTVGKLATVAKRQEHGGGVP